MTNKPIATIKTETRRPEITATEELWHEFDAWWKQQSCTTVADGLRTAMKIVTNFNSESQEKSGPEPTTG